MKVHNNSIFVNKRVSDTGLSTLGILNLDNLPIGFVIEDGPGQRIPAGFYRLGIKETITPLTEAYRKKYKWFKKHIELKNVPKRSHIYIHVGNKNEDTEGCQVIGLDASTSGGEYINKYSLKLFKEFYESVYPELEAGKVIYYKVIDNK